MMDLATCTTVKSADLKSKKRHSFEISTPETQHLLYADTESEKDDWIGRVGKAIVRCSRTYYSNTGSGSGNNNNNSNQPYLQGDEDDDDDIYTNDDPNNPYFND
jgi:PH domain